MWIIRFFHNLYPVYLFNKQIKKIKVSFYFFKLHKNKSLRILQKKIPMGKIKTSLFKNSCPPITFTLLYPPNYLRITIVLGTPSFCGPLIEFGGEEYKPHIFLRYNRYHDRYGKSKNAPGKSFIVHFGFPRTTSTLLLPKFIFVFNSPFEHCY